MLRATSGREPKPCMVLDFTQAIRMSGTTRKIKRVCEIVAGRYCIRAQPVTLNYAWV